MNQGKETVLNKWKTMIIACLIVISLLLLSGCSQETPSGDVEGTWYGPLGTKCSEIEIKPDGNASVKSPEYSYSCTIKWKKRNDGRIEIDGMYYELGKDVNGDETLYNKSSDTTLFRSESKARQSGQSARDTSTGGLRG